ncbi:MAG: four helix bundle protein [Acidobacteriales bacterium]|nr:four helix bundle protein [Terriglobales bacterium]
MQDFKKLDVWNRAHKLTAELHRRTRSFPREELFGITAQIRRAAGSIGANIAEGCGRGSDSDFARFIQMALGSASELENHLILALDLDLLKVDEHEYFDNEVTGVKRMLASLLKRLRK